MAEEKEFEKTFTLKTESGNEAQIKRLVDETRKTSITHSNYKKPYDQWLNTRNIILAQIENEYSQYVEETQRYREMKEEPRVKSAMQNRVVPLEMYETVLKLHYRAKQITSWKFLEAEFSQVLLQRIAEALGEVKALDIEREVLSRMNEMEKQRHELFMEIMNERWGAMDNKFLAALKIMEEQHRVDAKENITILSNAITTNADLMRQAVDVVLKSVKEASRDGILRISLDGNKLHKDLTGVDQEIKNSENSLKSEVAGKKTADDMLKDIGDMEAHIASTSANNKKPVTKPKTPDAKPAEDIETEEEMALYDDEPDMQNLEGSI